MGRSTEGRENEDLYREATPGKKEGGAKEFTFRGFHLNLNTRLRKEDISRKGGPGKGKRSTLKGGRRNLSSIQERSRGQEWPESLTEGEMPEKKGYSRKNVHSFK